MNPLPTMMFASVIVAALAGAEARKMTLVKGSPTTDSFDISWVDNATQKVLPVGPHQQCHRPR